MQYKLSQETFVSQNFEQGWDLQHKWRVGSVLEHKRTKQIVLIEAVRLSQIGLTVNFAEDWESSYFFTISNDSEYTKIGEVL